jgi:SAM-dependent methyltransferase
MELRKKMFFYAEDDVAFFDDDADLNTPRYSDLHQFTFDLASSMISSLKPTSPEAQLIFVDIGSGTGATSLRILSAFPSSRMIAVDLCSPMHDVLRRKAISLLGPEEAASRIRYVTGDIASVETTFPAIGNAAYELSGSKSISFVVSALTLHHLSVEEKREVYQNIKLNLAPKGFFLNADLYGYHSLSAHELAQKHTLDWIRKQHDPNTTSFPEALARLGGEAAEVGAKWVEHCERYNVLLPVEPASRHDPVPGDFDLLQEAGFVRVYWPYRFWQTALVVAEI